MVKLPGCSSVGACSCSKTTKKLYLGNPEKTSPPKNWIEKAVGLRTRNYLVIQLKTKWFQTRLKDIVNIYEFEWRTVTARFIVSLQQDSMFVISFCRFDLQKTSSSSVYLIQFSRFFSVINKWNSLLMTYLSEATTIPPIVGDLWVPDGQSHVGKILNGSVVYQCMDSLYSLTAKMWKTAVSTHVI